MELLELLGYISALIIGVSLGLIGGGGSVLAVPVLAYLFLMGERIATAYSLFIVGSSALVGGLRQHLKGNVDWRTVVIFGVPSIIGVTLVRAFLIPALPEVLFSLNSFDITRRMAMFGLFATLMIPAALSMLNKKERITGNSDTTVNYNYPLILVEGLIVGGITGLVGAGGGFLIIPALVLFAGIKMKTAIGTSLVIIAVKSLSGFFLGDALTMTIDWNFLAIITGLSFLGIFVGSYLGNFINGERLKNGFGYFIFAMAVFMFYMEFFVNP